MIRTRIVLCFGFLLLLSLPVLAALAETIELVTYYPAPGSTGDQHVRSLTVGTAYQGLDMSTNEGVALISRGLAIGVPVPVAGTIEPAGALEVRGLPNFADQVLFMPGTGTGTISVGIGTTAPATEFETVSTAAVQPRGILSAQYSTDNGAGLFIGRKARGTPTAPVSVANRDNLAGFIPEAYDGANYLQTGWMGYVVNGAVAAGSVPSDFVLSTGTSNQGVERLRVTSAGNVGIGTNAPSTPLDVNGQIRVRGGNPVVAGGVNPNATAVRPLFSDATGLASWGWPSGSVIQMAWANGGSGSKGAASTDTNLYPVFAAAGTATISITPRSNNSELLVEATFWGAVDLTPAGIEQNSYGYFRLYETTTGTAVARGVGPSAVAAVLHAWGARANAPSSIRALVPNGVTTQRTFQLYYAYDCLTHVNVTADNIVYTVTEIQN